MLLLARLGQHSAGFPLRAMIDGEEEGGQRRDTESLWGALLWHWGCPGPWGAPQQHTGMLTGMRMGRALNPAAFLQDSTAMPLPMSFQQHPGALHLHTHPGPFWLNNGQKLLSRCTIINYG